MSCGRVELHAVRRLKMQKVLVRKADGTRYSRNVSEAIERPFKIAYHDMYRDKEDMIDFPLCRKQFVRTHAIRSNGIPIAEFDNR